ncbi:tetratricopeptide repeat protein [Christiangramia sabulilitoris]|uniref:Tetratricopeptide repeat protein n=1 Tax=Christiangramia sabulilitoris TaxID=2583991 RepID=A0A550HZQ5_9FLAO|nr:tetratricopeptide repeat protein [Christiangramia sabulilitoris]TRO64165.1 tetratricopeptide repeat protein [Christiangramia sabulilitoris]
MIYLKKLPIFFILASILAVASCKDSGKESTEAELEDDSSIVELPVNTDSEEALEAFEEGLKYFDEGNQRKARAKFDEALDYDPNFVSAQMYRSFTANSAKDWANNRDKFMAMREKANEAEVMMMDMTEASMKSDTGKELEISKKMVEKYPESARAMDNLAVYYNNNDQEEVAREHWKKALELNPEYVPAMASLGGSYLFDTPKDKDQAKKYFEMLVETAPDSPRSHILMGDYYRDQDQLDQALASYEKAASLDPENENALAKSGHANSILGNYEEARKNFKDARAASEFGTNLGGEANTFVYEGNSKDALAFLEEGTKSFDTLDIPESNKNIAKYQASFTAAHIAMHDGDSKRLEQIVSNMKPISKQLTSEANSPVVTANQEAIMHYWDAMVMVSKKNYQEAAKKAEMIREAVSSINSPNKLDPYHRALAVINYHMGNTDKALEHIKQTDEDYIHDKYWMAKINEKAGNTEEAMELYEEISEERFNSIEFALIRDEVNKKVNADS